MDLTHFSASCMCNSELLSATHTHTHSRCILPILVLCACFIRLCCWSDKVARFELSRPHMCAWGQSNYRWQSSWWCIQANTYCNISVCVGILCTPDWKCCSCIFMMMMQVSFSVDLKVRHKENFAKKHCYGLFLHQQVPYNSSIRFDFLIWSQFIYQLPPLPKCGTRNLSWDPDYLSFRLRLWPLIKPIPFHLVSRLIGSSHTSQHVPLCRWPVKSPESYTGCPY